MILKPFRYLRNGFFLPKLCLCGRTNGTLDIEISLKEGENGRKKKEI